VGSPRRRFRYLRVFRDAPRVPLSQCVSDEKQKFRRVFVADAITACNVLQHIRRGAMKRDEDPPEDEQRCEPGRALVLQWPERIPPDELRRRRAQGIERDATSPAATEEWIDAFSEQYSRPLMEFVARYAADLLSNGGSVPPYADDAQTLAQDALSDTLIGRRRWDPTDNQRRLQRHLLDLVRRRIFAAWKRARELPHLSIDGLDADGEAPGSEEMERTLRERAPDVRTAESVRDDIAELCRRAADDPDVLALIRAKLGEQAERADTMLVAGLSPQRYRAALRRLHRLGEAMRAEQNLTPKRR
jgi:hypothetical protein